MLAESKLSTTFCADAANTAAFSLNRNRMNAVKGKTPYEPKAIGER